MPFCPNCVLHHFTCFNSPEDYAKPCDHYFPRTKPLEPQRFQAAVEEILEKERGLNNGLLS